MKRYGEKAIKLEEKLKEIKEGDDYKILEDQLAITERRIRELESEKNNVEEEVCSCIIHYLKYNFKVTKSHC